MRAEYDKTASTSQDSGEEERTCESQGIGRGRLKANHHLGSIQFASVLELRAKKQLNPMSTAMPHAKQQKSACP